MKGIKTSTGKVLPKLSTTVCSRVDPLCACRSLNVAYFSCDMQLQPEPQLHLLYILKPSKQEQTSLRSLGLVSATALTFSSSVPPKKIHVME